MIIMSEQQTRDPEQPVSDPEQQIHPHLAFLESFVNFRKVEEISRAEALEILKYMKRAASEDANLDAKRKDLAVAKEETLQTIDAIITEATKNVEDDSTANIEMINATWLRILPLLEYNFERPAILNASGTVFISADTNGIKAYTSPENGSEIPSVKFVNGREVACMNMSYHSGMWWANVVNPTDPSMDVWIPVGTKMENVVIAPEIPVGNLDEKFWSALRAYVKRYDVNTHTESGVLNRTYENRLADHERLLHAILEERNRAGIPAREALHNVLYPGGDMPTTFIDIGPGVNDAMNPASSSIEMAKAFPEMRIIAFDLPENVEAAQHKAEEDAQSPHQKLFSIPNMIVRGGNGLAPLIEQLKDEIPQQGTIIVRIANSLEIYSDWDTPNGDHPSFKNVIARLAEETKDLPVLLLLNRAIVVKQRGSTQWCAVGRVSSRGFNSIDRRQSTRGRMDFDLDLKTLQSLS